MPYRTTKRAAIAVGLVMLSAPVVAGQGAPGWLKLLHWISGNSDATTVPIIMMGPHMQMTRLATKRPVDRARADAIVVAARAVLARYPTVEAAQRDGYKPFHETGEFGEEVHLTSIGYGYAEGKQVDYNHPGSILFRRTAQGLKPVGVMYSAPGSTDAGALDARAPLSIATWHRHVDYCWALGARDAENSGPRFGYGGSIHDEVTCRAERGYWLPLAFGWMTHVYPGRAKPWGGEEMGPGMAGMSH